MMNLAEYRRPIVTAWPTSCPGPHWSTTGVVLNKDGSFSARRVFVDRIWTPPCRPNWSRRRPSEQRVASSRLRLGDLRRGAAARLPTAIPKARFPDAASAPGRCQNGAREFEEEGAHYESSYFLTLSLLAAARRHRARGRLALRGPRRRQGRGPRGANAGFVDRTDRVLRLVEGFMPEAELAR